jgi:soluble lytic murein transglycosylase
LRKGAEVKSNQALILFLLLLGAPLGAGADIYQYTDENGVVHFTNVNYGGKKHRKVKSEPSRAATEPAPAPSKKDASSAVASSIAIPASYAEIISSACAKHNVDPSLVHAIVKVESDFNPYALSRKGAMGLMQLMPQTAVDMNVRNSFNPHENIEGGVRYIRYLMDRYEGNLSLALAAYNAGETSVQRWGTIPPFRETQNYVRKVLRFYNGTDLPSGTRYATRYTVYVGYGNDGSLVFTDNPQNTKAPSFTRTTVRGL